MKLLNLGILAHVDAGKTSLTERLLYEAGVIDEVGSVDDGNTRTDSLELERQRGITIKSAVVSFEMDGVAVNLIDTPGHPDFIAEVERVLSVLDGAVLVISAVEGVQAQTRVLMRTLQRLCIPTLIFVNKIDRAGARPGPVLDEIAARLTPAIVSMESVRAAGTRATRVSTFEDDDAVFTASVVDLLTEHDESFLAEYVADPSGATCARLRRAMAEQTTHAQVHPVLFGSAITGAGIPELRSVLPWLLPTAGGDPEGSVSGSIFKVERGAAGEKIGYVRMFSGTLRTRDRLTLHAGKAEKVTSISVFDGGTTVGSGTVRAGQIGKLWGLASVRVGDVIGAAPDLKQHHFAPPTLETVVVARPTGDDGPLFAALTQLAEQDPLINFRRDQQRRQLALSLYGEVQKEVVQATLAAEYGIDVSFRETTTVCIERPVGAGSAVEVIATDANPFLATVGLRIEAAPVDSGVTFRLGVELGSMPYAFFAAVEETVVETLRQGLHGWRVTDCVVTMTHSGYWARQSRAHGGFDASMSSTAGDFRNLTPLVLMDALSRAGTGVYEPLHRFHLELPVDTFGTVVPVLARLGAVPESPSLRGTSYTVEGVIPAGRVHELTRRLPGLTRGEGVLYAEFASYRQVHGRVPVCARSDDNPLDRTEYLLNLRSRR